MDYIMHNLLQLHGSLSCWWDENVFFLLLLPFIAPVVWTKPMLRFLTVFSDDCTWHVLHFLSLHSANNVYIYCGAFASFLRVFNFRWDICWLQVGLHYAMWLTLVRWWVIAGKWNVFVIENECSPSAYSCDWTSSISGVLVLTTFMLVIPRRWHCRCAGHVLCLMQGCGAGYSLKKNCLQHRFYYIFRWKKTTFPLSIFAKVYFFSLNFKTG